MDIRKRDEFGRFIKTRQPKFCKDCQKKLSNNPTAIRCHSCSKKELYKDKTKNPMFGRKGVLHPMFGRTGSKNPFFGKKHSEQSREIIRLKATGRRWTEERKKIWSIRNTGKGNPLYGSTWSKGSRNPNWKGGISLEPYDVEFNKQIKEEIRKRDNHLCQICHMTEEEHLIVLGEILNIHHIDYNKKNSKRENLISLCRQCHSRVHYNRDYWIKFFKETLCLK